jgi:hypothetical protein
MPSEPVTSGLMGGLRPGSSAAMSWKAPPTALDRDRRPRDRGLAERAARIASVVERAAVGEAVVDRALRVDEDDLADIRGCVPHV